MATSLYKAQEASRTCDLHDHEELSCFCKTCEKLICTKCAKTEHHEHEWDIVSLVAKKSRKETPKLCRKIKQEKMSRCREKLRDIDDNISAFEKESDDDLKKLEEKRTELMGIINNIIDEKKRKREKCRQEGITKMEEQRNKLMTKIQYLDKMTTSLDDNIGAYSDYDVIEMELAMLKTLEEIENCDCSNVVSVVKFVQGELKEGVIENMIGDIEETALTNVDGPNVSVDELKTFGHVGIPIKTIAAISSFQAWVGQTDGTPNLDLYSLQDKVKNLWLPRHSYFVPLKNGDFIMTVRIHRSIRRITQAGNLVNELVNTKPLHPTFISQTQKENILVTMRDDGQNYKLGQFSRRLVQQMTLTGKVLYTYEFREDGTTRLFTLPGRTTENGNADICVINRTGDDTGKLIVLYGDGRVRFIYSGQKGSKFDPMDVTCDSNRRILISDRNNKSIHLLSTDGTYLRYLLSDMFDKPRVMSLYQNSLWIGFNDGIMKVYKYTE